MEGYYYGPDEDGTCWTGPFDTREEAIAEGRAEYGDSGERSTFYTAHGVPAKPDLDGWGLGLLEDIAEHLHEDVSPHNGPWDDWPDPVSKEEVHRLNALVAQALTTWFDETGRWPAWFVCEDVQGHAVDAADEDGDVCPDAVRGVEAQP